MLNLSSQVVGLIEIDDAARTLIFDDETDPATAILAKRGDCLLRVHSPHCPSVRSTKLCRSPVVKADLLQLARQLQVELDQLLSRIVTKRAPSRM